MEIAARELIASLLEHAPSEMRFTAFVNRESSDASWVCDGRLATVRVPVRARSRVQWVLGEQTLIPRLAARAGVDLLHSLASTAPLSGRFRRVLTVHDLIYARFPDAHAGFRDKGMKLLVPWGVRRSHRVIAISQSTRRDLIELLGVSPGLIDVVPNGMGSVVRQPPLPPAAARERLGLGTRRVVLSLSAKRPHKNLLRLLGALARIPVAARPLLVIPGYPTGHEVELRARAQALAIDQDVLLLGWLSGAELEGLWGVAEAFVFPSLYEGFGLPVLEAMARAVPVACSNTSALPEVAGDAALLFDPLDEAAIASTLERLLTDDGAAERLRARGLERVRQFTWERAARGTLESYRRAIDARA
jgi:glycosyltransferase involved in cell wall biosynthesis